MKDVLTDVFDSSHVIKDLLAAVFDVSLAIKDSTLAIKDLLHDVFDLIRASFIPTQRFNSIAALNK